MLTFMPYPSNPTKGLSPDKQAEEINTHSDASSVDEDTDNLAQELNQLSLKEREKVLYDLHGVLDEQEKEETEELIESSRQELELLIEHESKLGGNATLQMAETHGNTRLHDAQFQLMFLRADLFDAKKAFNRMMLHFEQVRILFGTSLMDKKITLQDLDEEALELLETGFLQMPPVKDRSGRQIAFCSVVHSNFEDYSEGALLRAAYYAFMSTLEIDEEFQKRGCVIVMSYFGFVKKFYPMLAWNAHKLFESIPVKTRGHHAFVRERGFGSFIRFRKLWERHRRIRSRVHYGTLMECFYALLTFGIPIESVPLSLDGTLKKEQHMEWLRQRSHPGTISPIQSAPSSTFPPLTQCSDIARRGSPSSTQDPTQKDLIVSPSRNDVLFGRGRPIQEHHGNVVFNNLLEAVRDRYDGLRRSEKTALTHTIVSKIKRAGGRFLRQSQANPDLWEEVDDDMARVKVSHTFRSLRQLQKVKGQQQMT